MELNKNVSLSQQSIQFLSRHKALIDQIQQGLLWSIVIAILLYGIIAINSPISTVQHKEIASYQKQFLYTNVRELAVDLMQQSEPVTQMQYYRFLRVLNFEQQRIRYQQDMDVQ